MSPPGQQATIESKILEWIQHRRDELEEHLLELVEMETPTEAPERFPEFFDRLRSDFEAIGLQTERHEGEEMGGWLEAMSEHADDQTECQLVLGHADTVWPVGTVGENPPGRDENVLHGPGALDMKGGLTQLVFALRALDDLSAEPTLPIHVLISSDEEVGSPESKSRIVDIAKQANRVFVLEPAQGPEGKIKIARKTVGKFTISIEGEAAHAGLDPEKGASAVDELGSLINRLHGMTDLEAGVTVNVGEVEAGLRSNVIAPNARAEIDVRAPTNEAARRVEQQIRNLDAETLGTELRVVGGFDRPPMVETPGNRLLWERVKIIGDRLGMKLEGARSGGASDGNFASQHAPTIDGLGAVGDGAHQEYEYVDLDRLPKRVALLASCLLDRPIPEDPKELV